MTAPTLHRSALADLEPTLHDAVLQPARLDDGVGLEVEAFLTDQSGRRLPLREAASFFAAAGLPARPGSDPSFRLDGATITFEPGGQLEVSSDPLPTVSEAIGLQQKVWDTVADLVPGRVVFAGLDLWNDLSRVPQQLIAPRYPAMEAYLSRRSSAGRLMMRQICSIQINLDGGGQFFGRRLTTAQALAPFITATFSTSPLPRAHGGRARIWQRLDPTRTGFLDASGDPAGAVWEMALAANVMLVRRGEHWHAGKPGLSFREWAEGNHPDWGHPTHDDLLYHLTTLFPEVRPRYGTIEVRTPDALPLRLLPVVVSLVTAAVYHPDASATILDLTSGKDLHHLWRRAATGGMADPVVGPLARSVWTAALEAAGRMPHSIEPSHLKAAARFLDGGANPTQELAAAMSRSPEHGLEWATYRRGEE